MIDPNAITTVRVGQLADAPLNLTDNIPHEVGTDLKRATIQELVNFVSTAIGAGSGVGFLPISVTDGQQLPDVPTDPSFFLAGTGTFLNINGYPNIVCTEELNAIMSLSDHWEIAVEIPISADFPTGASNYVTKFSGGSLTESQIIDNGARVLIGTTVDNTIDTLQIDGSLIATEIKKLGGTSSQILAADGSVITAGDNITIVDGQISSIGGGGGATVNYYLNGGTSVDTFDAVNYYEFSQTAVLGTGADFSRGSNGYIASFITEVADPSLLLIPAGNWNLEFFFSSSQNGGSPSFYAELYKYDGVDFTLIASNSTTPEGITNGTAIDAYFTAIAVPETVLNVSDRLAIRIFVNTSSKTITLHTQDSHLCEVITTFVGGEAIPTLQQVTDAGAITTNPITIDGIAAANGLNINLIDEATGIVVNTNTSFAAGVPIAVVDEFSNVIFSVSHTGAVTSSNTNTGLVNASSMVIATPETSVETYDLLTRNITTGEVEKIASSIFDTPTLQQVTTAGATTNVPINITTPPDNSLEGLIVTTDDNSSGGGVPSIRGVGIGITTGIHGVSDTGVAVYATTNEGTAVDAQTSSGTGVNASSNTGTGVNASSNTGKAGVFGILGTSNIVEFQKNTINQASISHDGKITANAIITTGGTSSQFLKADGSIDSNTYATTSGVILTTTDQTFNGIKSSINTGTSQINGLNLTNNGTTTNTFSIKVLNTNSGFGINAINNLGGSAIQVTNNGYGSGINVESSDGVGVNIIHLGAAYGLHVDNSGLGEAIHIDNTSNGKAILVRGSTTSNGFLYVGQNDTTNTFTVNKTGDVTSNSFIKSGGTSSQYLMADGSTSTGGGATPTLQQVTTAGDTTTVPTVFATTDPLSEDINSITATTDNGIGVFASSGTGTAVDAYSTSGIAIKGSNFSGIAILGYSSENTGVDGTSTDGIGVDGQSLNGIGVNGGSINGIGVNSYSENGVAISADAGIANTSNIAEFKNNGVIQTSISNDGNVTSNSFIKDGGTSDEFLKADGTVDSNVYVKPIVNEFPGTTVTGTSSETLLSTFTIPAGTLPASCMPDIRAKFSKSGDLGNAVIRLKINTVNNFATATLIGTYSAVAATDTFLVSRNPVISGGNMNIFIASSSGQSDISNTAVTESNFTIDVANDIYLFVSVVQGAVGDTTTLRAFKIIN